MTSQSFENFTSAVNTSSSNFTCEDQIAFLRSLAHKNLTLGVLHLQTGLCGISCLVSLVNLVILCHPLMTRISFNLLLASLEVSNFIMAVTYIPPAIVLSCFPSCLIHFECTFIISFIVVTSFSSFHFSCWMIGIVGVWRLVAIAWPHKVNIYLTRLNTKITIYCLAILCYIPGVYVGIVCLRKYFGRSYLCKSGDFGLDGGGYVFMVSDGNFWIFIATLVLYETLPAVCLLVCTIYMFRILAVSLRSRKLLLPETVPESQRRIASIVPLTIFLLGFLLSNQVHLLPYYLHYMNYDLPNPWKYLLEVCLPSNVMNILSLLIYYHMSTYFRLTFLQVFLCSRNESRRMTSWPSVSTQHSNM